MKQNCLKLLRSNGILIAFWGVQGGRTPPPLRPLLHISPTCHAIIAHVSDLATTESAYGPVGDMRNNGVAC